MGIYGLDYISADELGFRGKPGMTERAKPRIGPDESAIIQQLVTQGLGPWSMSNG